MNSELGRLVWGADLISDREAIAFGQVEAKSLPGALASMELLGNLFREVGHCRCIIATDPRSSL
jgi:hypothetical protein